MGKTLQTIALILAGGTAHMSFRADGLPMHPR